MPIDSDTRRDLRRIAHHLKPVVTVAERGLSDSVVHEIERALSDHELIKVKLAIADREVRAAVTAEMVQRTGADHVADIGKIAIVFKANPKARPQLSNLRRHGVTRPA
jgi:RNA-binding protein